MTEMPFQDSLFSDIPDPLNELRRRAAKGGKERQTTIDTTPRVSEAWDDLGKRGGKEDAMQDPPPNYTPQPERTAKPDGFGGGDRLLHDHHMPSDPWNHPELPRNAQEEAEKTAGIAYTQESVVDAINVAVELRKAGGDERLARLRYQAALDRRARTRHS